METNWLDPFIKASPIKSQEDLADKLDVSRATINRLANDHSKLKLDRAKEMAQYLNVSAEDLMLNRPPGRRPDIRLVSSFDPDAAEQEFVDEQEEGEAQPGSYTREHWQPRIQGAIPEIDVKLGAGHGIVGETINLPVGGGAVTGHRVIAEWVIPEDYLRNVVGASPSHALIHDIIGDSMTPTYLPGDKVIVDLSQNAMTTDTVYAISDGFGEPQIKRLQRIPFSEPPQVVIISDNPNLERFTVELSRLTIVGRIVSHISRK
jgi:SOS-response transcriptional repressor LexA